MKQSISYLWILRKPTIQLLGRSCVIFSLRWYPTKLVRIINMCLNETYCRVQVGKLLNRMSPIKKGMKQGDALSPLLFSFVSEYAFTRVQVN